MDNTMLCPKCLAEKWDAEKHRNGITQPDPICLQTDGQRCKENQLRNARAENDNLKRLVILLYKDSNSPDLEIWLTEWDEILKALTEHYAE